jgi:hypothetical protein
LRSYELKFVVDARRGADILAWVRSRLAVDPNGDPALGGAYDIHTLYLDTAAFDVYSRRDPFRRRKLRLRRYGEEDVAFVEEKLRKGDRVAKRRTGIAMPALASLANGTGHGEAPSDWFFERVGAQRLLPAVRITYRRSAFVGSGSGHPFRLTIDEGLDAVRERDFRLDRTRGGTRLLDGHRVLELKYQRILPSAFKEIIRAFTLSPEPLSKYRLAVEALAMVPAEARGR